MSSQMQEPVSLLRLPEVKRRVGLSRSTIYARIGRGEFPRPINLGAAVSAWDSREIDRWIAERSEEHTSELQSLMRISYAVFCLKKKIHNTNNYLKQIADREHKHKRKIN